jgi:hypothetical protein
MRISERFRAGSCIRRSRVLSRNSGPTSFPNFFAKLEASMKYTHPSLRWVSLAPAALACLIGACGGDDSNNPNPNPTPQMDASTTPDQSSPPPPPPDGKTTLDAGTITCGTAVCSGRLVGGQIGAACCAGTQMNRCGLLFLGGTMCIDQSDSGGITPPPPTDAGPIVDDPSCGMADITFQGMTFPLIGCCRAGGQCGWYSPLAQGQGCASAEQLRMFPGATVNVPDAGACSGEGGTRPDTGTPDTSRPETGTPDSTTTPDTGTVDAGGADTTADTATPDTTTPDTNTPPNDGTTVDSTTDTGPQSDGASPDAGTD